MLHWVHVVAPASLVYAMDVGEQVLHSIWPLDAAYELMAQRSHDVAPATLLKLPAGHGRHDDIDAADAYFPAGQPMHALAPRSGE